MIRQLISLFSMISAFASLPVNALTLVCAPDSDKEPANPSKAIELLKNAPNPLVRGLIPIIYIDEKNDKTRLEYRGSVKKGALFATQGTYTVKFTDALKYGIFSQYEINRVDGSYRLLRGSRNFPPKVTSTGKCAPLPEVKTMF